MMPVARIVGILCFVLAAGCTGLRETPPSAMAQRGPLMVDPSLLGRNQDSVVAAETPRSEAKEKATVAPAPAPAVPPPAVPPQPMTTAGEASGNEPATGATAPPSAGQAVAKSETPTAKAPAEVSAAPAAKAPAAVSASPAAIQQPRTKENAPPVAKSAEPPLDVAALKARLRDTNAIGVFTKLALKNQVDDLLKQFRAHYQSGRKTNVSALRQPYDMLVLKVLALIQDSDPSLARTISGSREAIWSILADPEKFNSVS